ncbi:MAG: hypothetical protein AAGM38_18885, partial [Pseudomonadota bacterium]
MREGVALEKGFALYREYTEEDAAAFLEMHPHTLAQIRREGLIFFVRKGPRHIRYIGMRIADFIISSVEQLDAAEAEAEAKTPAERAPSPKARG